MGQKVHPIGYRLGVIRDWESKWYANGEAYHKALHEDLALREWIKKRWEGSGISRVEIERVGKIIRFTILTARPGVVIGKQGAEINKLKEELQAKTGAKVMVIIQEIKNPEVEAQLVAENIAAALENRVSFRRAMKQAMFRTMKSGGMGIKVSCAGRLGGAEIARTEWYNEGRLPLSTLRADVDYGFASARTMYGSIGVKVWIYRDEKAINTPAVRAPRRGAKKEGGRG